MNRFQSHRSLVGIFAFAAFLFLTIGLRNTTPFTAPYIFGEDNAWLSAIWRDGLVSAALYVRPDFPVAIQMIVLQAALLLNGLLFGDDVARLPAMVFVASNAFLTLVALSPLLLWRHAIALRYCLLMGIAIAWIPMDGVGNFIFGRTLNLAWYMPVALTFVIARLLIAPTPRPVARIALLVIAELLMLSFAVCILQFALFVFAHAVLRWREDRRLPRMAAIHLAMLVSVGLAIDPAAGGSSAAFSNTVHLPGLVEFAFARSALFPFIRPLYWYLNDTVVIAILLALLVAAIAMLCYRRRLFTPNLSIAIIIANAALYWAVTIVLRRGASQFYGDYNAAPDFYLVGISISIMVAVIAMVAALKPGVPKQLATVALSVLPVTWIAYHSVFERERAQGHQQALLLIDSICAVRPQATSQSARFNAIVKPQQGLGTVWTLDVPRLAMIETAASRCSPAGTRLLQPHRAPAPQTPSAQP